MESIFKTIKPHLIAFVIGLLVLFVYFPAVFLESKVIDMSDINRSSATSKEIRDFREKTGIEPLWTNSQFGGMPAFQMNIAFPNNLIGKIERYSKDFLPSQLGLLFTMFLGFYFLSVIMGVKPWISVVGSFAFAFSTFFIVSMESGHTGKLRAIGYMAPVMAGIIMTMRGRYLLGGALTTLFLSLCINANHFQITYYLAIMVLAYLLTELYFHFREKELKAFMIKGLVLMFAAMLSVGPNISRLWTTYGYSKETMRGGGSELKKSEGNKSGGLEKDYAMSWSYGISETMTLLIPDFYGGSSTSALDAKSNTGQDLKSRGIPKGQLDNILANLPLYWGDQPFVSGPVYLGAVIVYLFVLAMFILRGRIKIWLIVCTVFSIVLSWGDNFEIVNDLFFYYFPFYNKFRTPSMILSVTSLSVVLLAVMALNKIIKANTGVSTYWPEIKKSFYITGGVCLFFALIGTSFYTFSGSTDAQLPEGWPVDALIEDRKDMMAFSSFKSLLFISACFGLLWALAKNKISPKFFIAGLTVCVVTDLWMVDKKYLNDDNLVKRKYRDDFYTDTQADKIILQDKDPNFRVFNLSVNPFADAMTSFHHKSVGGYHGAKLIKYQDVIDVHLSKNNSKVLDMLNTRYYIVPNRETGQNEVKGNPGALGNAWFVNNIIWAANADEEIGKLSDFNPSREVVIDERYRNYISADINTTASNSKITLKHYQPNQLIYEAVVENENEFAVFSEIYYEGTDHDWKVFVDGQPSEQIRVNYILRGMQIPKGNHTIEFRFEPVSYFEGEKYSLAFSILILVMVAGALIMEYRNFSKTRTETQD